MQTYIGPDIVSACGLQVHFPDCALSAALEYGRRLLVWGGAAFMPGGGCQVRWTFSAVPGLRESARLIIFNRELGNKATQGRLFK